MCVVFFVMNCTVAVASEGAGSGTLEVSPRKRARDTEQQVSPVDIADFFVALDNRDYLQDPKRSPVDPLKLQKLVYYAFSHIRENVNIDLWNLNQEPIIANYHGPFIRAVHDVYNGYSIKNDLIEKSLRKKHMLDEGVKTDLETVYCMFLSKTGKDLEYKSHEELPYLRTFLHQRLCGQDIAEEFRRIHHITPFLRELNSVCRKKGQPNFLAPVFKRNLLNMSIKDFESCLDSENKETIRSIDISWAADTFREEFCFGVDQPIIIDAVLSTMVYPKVLLDQVDARDSVLVRPTVIERVAIAANLGHRQAIRDLSDIFRLFSIDRNDCYDRTASILEQKTVGLNKQQTPCGYAAYQAAFEQNNSLDAVRLYKQSLNEGYARSAFELAKISLAEKNFPDSIEYAKQAFNKGMLTVTCFMMDLSIDESDKKDFLKKRGELGDPKGYYDLAKLFEQQGNKDDAIAYYKRSLPFYGYSELLRLHENISEEDVDRFFEEIVLIYNDKSIHQIWESGSSNVAPQE